MAERSLLSAGVKFLPYAPADNSNTSIRKPYLAAISSQLKESLCLSKEDFWQQAINNDSFRLWLDTYFAYCPRDLSSVSPAFREEEAQIQKKVFLVCLRLCTETEYPQSKVGLGDALYDNWLMDIPRLMDICLVFGSANKDIVSKLVTNVFRLQPKYMHDLEDSMPAFVDTLDKIQSSCNAIRASKTSNGQQCVTLLEELSDVCHTLDAFVTHFTPAIEVVLHFNLVQLIATVYDSCIPILYCYVASSKDSVPLALWRTVNRLTLSAVHTLWSIAYIQTITSKHDVIKAQEFADLLEQSLRLPLFLRQYDKSYSLVADILTISHTNPDIFHEEIVQRVVEAIQTEIVPVVSASSVSSSNHINAPAYGMALPKNQDERLVLDSQISAVREVLPDLGPGYVALCLSALNYSVEAVIDAVLSANVPASVGDAPQSLTLSELETPKSDTKGQKPVRSTTTKGNRQKKTAEEAIIQVPDVLASRRNVYDGDEFDVFSRNDVDTSRMHKGKRNKGNQVGSDRDAREVTRWMAKDYEFEFDEYEDEYDDTYDAVDVGGNDADSADELRAPGNRELPWAKTMTNHGLHREHRDGDASSDDEETGQDYVKSSTQTYRSDRGSQRGGGRGGAGRGQGRGAQKLGGRGRGRGGAAVENSGEFQAREGKGRGSGGKVAPTEQELRDRAYNDRNKGQKANHNRKRGAARKLAKAMN